MNQRWYNDEPPTEGRGRSAKKRAAEAVEELAKRLVALPEASCRKLPLSADLRKELQVARDTEAMGARKRQVKHFAGEMRRREEEIEAIQTFLDGADQVNLQARRGDAGLPFSRPRDAERPGALGPLERRQARRPRDLPPPQGRSDQDLTDAYPPFFPTLNKKRGPSLRRVP
jgi:ribosome-associated protein